MLPPAKRRLVENPKSWAGSIQFDDEDENDIAVKDNAKTQGSALDMLKYTAPLTRPTIVERAPEVNLRFPISVSAQAANVTKCAALDAMYSIKKENMSDSVLNQHRQWLTIQKLSFPIGAKKKTAGKTPKAKKVASDPGSSNTDKEEEDVQNKIVAFEETPTLFRVPRAYGLSVWGMPNENLTTSWRNGYNRDYISSSNNADNAATSERFLFVGSLKTAADSPGASQVEVFDEIMKSLQHPRSLKSGILKLYTGFGKTVMLMRLIAELKVPTLILVDSGELLSQAMEKCTKHLPNVRTGIIRESKCEYKDRDVVFGMFQTITRNKYDDSVYQYFGMVAIDEVHKAMSPSYLSVIKSFIPEYLIGLSATPSRGDGTSCLLPWFIGPLIVERKRPQVPCNVRCVTYSQSQKQLTGETERRIMELKYLSKDGTRNALLVDLLAATLTDRGVPTRRKILALSEYRKHLNFIKCAIVTNLHQSRDGVTVTTVAGSELDPPKRKGGRKKERTQEEMEEESIVTITWKATARDSAKDIKKGIVRITIGRYLPKMRPNHKEAVLACDLILATPQIAAVGLDIPPLDTIFDLLPSGNNVQRLGRILREYDGKNIPLVIDIRDANALGDKLWWRRRAHFVAERMNIQQHKME